MTTQRAQPTRRPLPPAPASGIRLAEGLEERSPTASMTAEDLADATVPVLTQGDYAAGADPLELTASESDYVLLPEDVYTCTLVALDDPADGEFGPYTILRWMVDGGEYDQMPLDELASLKASPSAKLRLRCEALLGRQYVTGEAIRPRTLIGKQCRLLVKLKKTDKGEFNEISQSMALPVSGQRRPAGR